MQAGPSQISSHEFGNKIAPNISGHKTGRFAELPFKATVLQFLKKKTISEKFLGNLQSYAEEFPRIFRFSMARKVRACDSESLKSSKIPHQQPCRYKKKKRNRKNLQKDIVSFLLVRLVSSPCDLSQFDRRIFDCRISTAQNVIRLNLSHFSVLH